MPSRINPFQLKSSGVTRYVVLVGRLAIKVPRLDYGWRLFLCGLLANMQEREFSWTGWPELCPVVASLPGGWLVIMRRARLFTDAEFDRFDMKAWGELAEREDRVIPVEAKSDSFGWLDGRVVAIDYGT
jgi:hypothetical protein